MEKQNVTKPDESVRPMFVGGRENHSQKMEGFAPVSGDSFSAARGRPEAENQRFPLV
jgi:hypothetical protein